MKTHCAPCSRAARCGARGADTNDGHKKTALLDLAALGAGSFVHGFGEDLRAGG